MADRRLRRPLWREAATACRMPYENDQAIWIARGMKVPVKESWPRTRKFM